MEEKKLPLIRENNFSKNDANNPKNINIQEILSKERLELLERLNRTKKSEESE